MLSTAGSVFLANKTVKELKERYERIHIVNLLSQKENSSECTLSEAYRLCVSRLTDLNDVISFTGFDFHAIVKRDNYEKVRSRFIRSE